MSKLRTESFTREAERILKRHGIMRAVLSKSPALAKKLEHIPLNMIRNVQLDRPEVDILIEVKRLKLPNEEYIALATLQLQSEMYDELLNEANSFLKGILIIAEAVQESTTGDVGKAEEELNALCDVYKRQTEMIETIIRDANERILKRTGVDSDAYDTYMKKGGSENVKQKERELDAAKRNVLAKLESVKKLESEVRGLIANKRAPETGYSDHGSHGTPDSSGQSYFGTGRRSGRCRRSTSFGKYVLSLS
jgi:hypothetical protein